jgi:hypothetical protein
MILLDGLSSSEMKRTCGKVVALAAWRLHKHPKEPPLGRPEAHQQCALSRERGRIGQFPNQVETAFDQATPRQITELQTCSNL